MARALTPAPQNTHMRRGRPTHAAGPASTGTAPIPTLKIPSHFGNLHPCNVMLLDLNFAALAKFTLTNASGMRNVSLPRSTGNRHSRISNLNFAAAKFTLRNAGGMTKGPSSGSRISNRHLVQLEITATPTKSTRSLFLIDTKRPYFSKALLDFRRGGALAPPSRHATLAALAAEAISSYQLSNVYSMQLETPATPTPSTKLTLLMCTPPHTYRSQLVAASSRSCTAENPIHRRGEWDRHVLPVGHRCNRQALHACPTQSPHDFGWVVVRAGADCPAVRCCISWRSGGRSGRTF